MLTFSGSETPTPTWPALLITIFSILSKEWIFHYTRRAGEQIRSNILIANAWHSRTDVFSSVVVLFGVGGAMLGLTWLDAVAAIIVALIIGQIGLSLIWDSMKELVDTGVEETLIDKISREILGINGILAIHQLRTRHHGKNILLDVHIEVGSHISISEGHYISEQVNTHLNEIFPQIIDVTTHIDPENDETPDNNNNLPNRLTVENLLDNKWQAIDSAQKIQKIILHYLNGKISIEIYLPLAILNKQEKDQLANTYRQTIKDINYVDNIAIYFQ